MSAAIPPAPRTIPLRRLAPNILTTVSLCSGLAAIHFSLVPNWDKALAAIAVAAVFDLLDGAVARVLRATSRFGAVLDSLSDFLSFGVAPAVILHQWMLREAGPPGLAATMLYVLCAAMRLARFTSARRTPKGSPLARFFVGLPTPAAAGAVLVPALLASSRAFEGVRPPEFLQGSLLPEMLVVAYTILVGWLMVSRVPAFSLKRIRVRRGLVPLLLIGVALLVVAAAKDTWLTAAVLALAYLCTFPFSVITYRRIRRSMAGAPESPARETRRPALAGNEA